MLERLVSNLQAYPLDYIGHIFILLPVALSIYRRQFLTKELILLILFFLTSFLEECIQLYYSLKAWSNIHLYNLYLIVDIFLVGCIYYQKFEFKIHKKYIVIATSISIIISIIFFKYDEFSSVGNTVFRIFSTALVLSYFNWLLVEMKIANMLLHSFFWISAGLLLYSLGTFFMYLFSQYTISAKASSNIFDLYWSVKQILYILFCVFSSIGFWVSKYDIKNYV